MAKFLIYTDEHRERQHRFILRFYPEAYQAKQKRSGSIVWYKSDGDPQVVGKSEILKKQEDPQKLNGYSQKWDDSPKKLDNSPKHNGSSSIHLLTLYSEFLTYTTPGIAASLDDVVQEMSFRVVGRP